MEKNFAAAYAVNAMLVAGSNNNVELFTQLVEEQSDEMKVEIVAHLVGMLLGVIENTDRSVEDWLVDLGTLTALFEAESE